MRRKKRRITYNLDLGGGTPFSSRDIPPAVMKKLGPAKFSEQDQARNVAVPMTRVVKDVLRVGKWCVGEDSKGPKYWGVKGDTLNRIENNFRTHIERGILHNLCWGHGDSQTGIVDERNSIADLDNAVRVGDTLWISAYVTPETARDLQAKNRHVSVSVADTWRDGRGEEYDESLLHVAVVDHAVVPGQGPFQQLSIGEREMAKKTTTGKRRTKKFRGSNGKVFDLEFDDFEEDDDDGDGEEVAEGDDDDGDMDGVGLEEEEAADLSEDIDASPPGTTVVVLDDIVEKINRILPQGVDLPVEGPAAVTEQNFSETFEIVMAVAENTGMIPTAEQKEQEDAEARGEDEGLTDGGDVLAMNDQDPILDELPQELANHPMVQAMQLMLEPMQAEIKSLSGQMGVIKKGKKTGKKKRFLNQLGNLGAEGKVTGAQAEKLQLAGLKFGYDLSLLSPFQADDSETVMQLGSSSRKMASGKAPKVHNLGGKRTPEDIQRMADMIPGGKRREKTTA